MRSGQYFRFSMVCLGVLLLLGLPNPQSSTFTFAPDSEVEWRAFMQLHTAEESYRQFRFLYGSDDIAVHTKAHQIGVLLYETFGEGSMYVCDTAFSGGCVHGFMGRLIQEQGKQHIEEIAARCRVGRENDLYDNCEHGVGHALLYSYGYDGTGLEAALAGCDRYFSYEPQEALHDKQCYHGVLMEFNQQNTAHLDRLTTRSFDPDIPYEPCDRLQERHKAACYYRLVPFWTLADRQLDTTELYRRSGTWCRALVRVEYRSACLLGLQTSILEYSRITDITEAEELCSVAFEADANIDLCLSNMETTLVTDPHRHIF